MNKIDDEFGVDLTENNLDSFLADIETYTNMLIALKGNEKGNTSKSLLIDSLNIKDFR